MRGKEDNRIDRRCCYRITPAYAGKRCCSSDLDRAERDHPRLCGEKVMQTMTDLNILGSPPPMRGKAPTVTVVSPERGITPAYAGKSCGTGFVRNAERDHPRLCGEK